MPKKEDSVPEAVEAVAIAVETEEVVVQDEVVPEAVVEATPAKLPTFGEKPEFKPEKQVIVDWTKLTPRQQHEFRSLVQYWTEAVTIK